jgi:membrane associated rhomboid family serine protease
MEEPRAIWTIAILVVTVLVSWRGFTNLEFRERLIFEPVAILRDKQYYRMLTSGFLHGDFLHLLVNGYSLYAFAPGIELGFGVADLLLIYFGSILGGSLLSLWIHRHHDYRALGASGGVCGVIFAAIFLMPGGGVLVFPVPFSIPTWLYAIAFLAFSIVGLRRQSDNIGHDAHLGGAIIGLVIATALHPAIVPASPKLFATVMGIAVLLFVWLWLNPLWLPPAAWLAQWRGRHANQRMASTSRPPPDGDEVDRLLDKIRARGIHSLTAGERNRLKAASRKSDS